MSFAKCRSFCLDINVLKAWCHRVIWTLNLRGNCKVAIKHLCTLIWLQPMGIMHDTIERKTTEVWFLGEADYNLDDNSKDIIIHEKGLHTFSYKTTTDLHV